MEHSDVLASGSCFADDEWMICTVSGLGRLVEQVVRKPEGDHE